MIQRESSLKIIELATYFKAVVVTGPRQSGKTTLVKHLFPQKKYVSLENPDSQRFALEDPRGFLANYADGAIFDEIQQAPLLLSFLQEILDNSTQKGLFILTGSNNLLINQHISQTLAGRVGYFHLLPFSIAELYPIPTSVPDLDTLMLRGFYPPIHDQKIPPALWFSNYVRTYIERDVRQIKNITDLLVFERFMRLLAGRIGQELNMTSLANDVGVDIKTIQSWIGILESSFLVYLLRPYYRNFNKTVIKRPKLYFYDIGLATALLSIREESQLAFHPLRGSIFENLVIMNLLKQKENFLMPHSLYYWRDKTGHEIDLLVENGLSLLPVEIKSGQTMNTDYLKNLVYLIKLSETEKAVLLYTGTAQNRSNGIEVKNWLDFSL